MENKYSGMTVNERLWKSGLFNEFHKYVKEKDIEKVRSILIEVCNYSVETNNEQLVS